MAPDTVITVRGSWESRHPPERATVRLAVATEGTDRADVYARAAAAVGALTDLVRPWADDDGPVERWTTDRLHTWSDRPWDPETNRQGGLVFHGQARVQVEFRDLDALTPFLDEVAVRAEVAVEELSWALTEEHARDHARVARRRSVADAAERARDYAEAAGLHEVQFVAVADVGLLESSDTGGLVAHDGVVKMSMSGGGPMEFAPADITVAATVEARFVAT